MQHLQVQAKDMPLAFRSLTYFILGLLRERKKTCVKYKTVYKDMKEIFTPIVEQVQ